MPRSGGRLKIVAAILAGVVLLAGAYQFKLRDLSLFAVEQVEITGTSGPQAAEITAALDEAARGMTTLNVDEAALNEAVSGFATVTGVSADADFPHGLAVQVRERPPVLLAKEGDRVMPVAADGTILAGVEAGKDDAPVVEVSELPGAGTLQGADLDLATVAGGAPGELRPLITDIALDKEDGLTVELDGGIPLRFGTADRAADKWAAATAILASPKVDTLTYIDLRVPERPAVGGAAPPAEEELIP